MKELLMTGIKSTYQKKKKQCVFIICMIGFVIVMAAGFIIYNHFKPDQKTPVPEIKVSLEKIIEKNDLITIEYPVNRAITVWDKDGKHKKYYVSYKANVTAGIDASKITMEEIPAKKEGELPRFVVTLPKASYMSKPIDPESYDFLFVKQKYETETVLEEAARECAKDLDQYINEQGNQLEIARENAVRYMKAFLLPFEESMKGECTIEVR